MDHHAERPTEPLGERQDRDAIGNSERMVCDHDQRRVGQARRRPDAIDAKLDPDHAQHRGEEVDTARRDVAAPDVVERCETVAPRKALDMLDQETLQPAVAVIGVGELWKEALASDRDHDDNCRAAP